MPLYALVFEPQDPKADHTTKNIVFSPIWKKNGIMWRQVMNRVFQENIADEYETKNKSVRFKQNLRGSFFADFQVIFWSNFILKSQPTILYYRLFSIF